MNQKLENDFSDLISSVIHYNKKAEIKLIEKAWEFAKKAHNAQLRRSGEFYIEHPLNVAKYLADWKLDSVSIVAGLLHDTIEDTDITFRDIEKNFGKNVAMIVNGVTKVRTIDFQGNKTDLYAENIRKMLLVMAKDLRVVFVRLADRMHNLQTLWALDEEKQKENARETLEIYAPLAERLGVGDIKGQLEDLAFPYLFKEEYIKVKKESKKHYREVEKIIKKMKRELLTKLANNGIRANIHARKKRMYSLWRKLERPDRNWDFDTIHDIVALRILLKTVPDCYVALGVVHDLYKPAPNIGISDFIAQPKPNGYRSIHTKVFGSGGRIIEVQIRTFKMHEQAEYGLAAHWVYTQAKESGLTEEELEEGKYTPEKNIINWTKQLVEWQKQLTDSNEFLDAVKFDALSHRMFVFSPMGDVYDLPVGATPVDFAFSVHSDLGHYIKGAKVNGRMVTLSHELKSGDVVEILKTNKISKPKQHWLEFVKTNHAKGQIEKELRKSGKI